MQHSVFRSAHVKVRCSSVCEQFRISENLVVTGDNKSEIVPTGPCPLRHRIGLSTPAHPFVTCRPCFVCSYARSSHHVDPDLEPLSHISQWALAGATRQ